MISEVGGLKSGATICKWGLALIEMVARFQLAATPAGFWLAGWPRRMRRARHTLEPKAGLRILTDYNHLGSTKTVSLVFTRYGYFWGRAGWGVGAEWGVTIECYRGSHHWSYRRKRWQGKHFLCQGMVFPNIVHQGNLEPDDHKRSLLPNLPSALSIQFLQESHFIIHWDLS